MTEQQNHEIVPDGARLHCLSLDGPAATWYSYCPPERRVETPVLVCVHGITRNSLELLKVFLPFAKRHGFVLIVPHFSTQLFPDYQQLGVRGSGQRADQALESILLQAGRSGGVGTNKICLYGFSGGAQFAHRFAMLNPRRVERMVLSSAGWYTFPDLRARFPFGLRADDKRPDMEFVLPDLLVIPTLVLVGAEDTQRDAGLRKSAQVDARQGLTRVERGQRWTRAMAAAARHYNIHDVHQFQLLSGVDHEFSKCVQSGELASKTVRFLELDATTAIEDGLEKLAEI